MRLRLVLFLCIAILSISASISAQELDGSLRPTYSYAFRYSDRLTLNARMTFQTSLSDLNSSRTLQHIEPRFLFAYGLSPRFKVGGGYFYRHTNPLEANPGFEHRFLQQIGWIGYLGDRRIAHRVRLEQRFRDIPDEFRLRYRLSYDFPLQGSSLDYNEYYMVLKNEIVQAVSQRNYAAENRIMVSLGWFRDANHKAELGVEYRFRQLLSAQPINHFILVTTSFFLTR